MAGIAGPTTRDQRMHTQRDNVKTGLFVLIGLVLAVAIIFLLADIGSYFQHTQRVKVYYLLSDGLQGLKIGARVTIGGQPAGEVVDIDDFVPGADGRIEGSMVTITIPDKVKLYWNARIEVEKPPLGGSNTIINVASVGRPYVDDPNTPQEERVPNEGLYDPEQSIPNRIYREAFPDYRTSMAPDAPMRTLPVGALPGQIAGSGISRDFTRNIGITDLQRFQIQESIDNIHEITRNFRLVSAELGARPKDLADTINHIKEITAALRKDLPEITASVKASLAKAEKIVGDAEMAMADVQATISSARKVVGDVEARSGPWLDRVDDITKDARAAVENLRKVVAENDPRIAAAIMNIEGMTKTAKEQTLVQIEEALNIATKAIRNLEKASEEVKTMVIGQRPVIERFLANGQLMTAQLKLAAIEVRRSPWRLLYTPGDDEIAADNIYDAARSFALAASTLDAAARSMQAVAEKDPNNQAQIKRMLDDLEKLFGKYKEAEDEFWKALQKGK
jgi:ABC-type transporter Mla subunit MlaD